MRAACWLGVCVFFLRSADFDEPESKKAYEEAYVDILNFFQEHFLWEPSAPANQHVKEKIQHSPTTHEAHIFEKESHEKRREWEVGTEEGEACFLPPPGLPVFNV